MTNPAWDAANADTIADTGEGEDADTMGFGHEGPDPTTRGEADENPIGDGDGDPPGDGDGDPSGDGDGDGDRHGDGDGDWHGDGDGDGGDQVCGNAAPSFGPCPAACDECHAGVCYRYCGPGECEDDFLLCPVSWSCKVVCHGKDSCKNATLACTGWGTCDVECVDEHACADADILCAAGPCDVSCEGNASDRPCEHLDVKCGSDTTKLHCDEPYEGAGPTLSPNQYNKCGCHNECKAAD